MPICHDEARLYRFSKEHLLYELRMFRVLAKIFIEGKLMLNSNSAEIRETVNNSLVESFAIHSRNLIDFFYRDKGKSDDIFASYYFDDPDQWTKVRPVEDTKLTGIIRTRANKEVGHLTALRLNVEAHKKGWDEIARQAFPFLGEVLLAFVNAASSRYLATEVVALGRSFNSKLLVL